MHMTAEKCEKRQKERHENCFHRIGSRTLLMNIFPSLSFSLLLFLEGEGGGAQASLHRNPHLIIALGEDSLADLNSNNDLLIVNLLPIDQRI